GGGRVSNPDTGCTANFGLNVKYLKNGKPQGSVLYMEHCSTGDTKLKGNVMQSVSIVGRTAVIIGKGPLNGVGNYGFRINVTDNGEPGSSDLFGLQITAPNGSVVPGYNFAPRTIDAGNIQVPQNAK
ncbi:MAG TPA: post-COAP-1 domain-containing protein, partial [Pyrinomonadaceae bacterium]|nr:post-COAP-1 domain-containing protein [Pyrinomonadaceae bacterium]